VQATAEHTPFADEHLLEMISLARHGLTQLLALQQQALAARPS
jgi:ribonuclease PH